MPPAFPVDVVVGASDVPATARFLAALGFTDRTVEAVPAPAAAALHGHHGDLTEVVLRPPATHTGGVRVVPAAPATPPGPYAVGPRAIDVYTTDLAASLALARAAGARTGPPVTFRAGPVTLTGAVTHGPDDLPVVFLHNAHRLPSLLDRHPDRPHSEVHSLVWAVTDLPGATAFWCDRAGLADRGRHTFTDPAVSALTGLPDTTTVAMTVLAGPAADPPRLELLTFPDVRMEPVAPLPLRAGRMLPVCTTTAFDDTLAAFDGALLGPVVERTGGSRAVVGVAPGGVAFELREVRS